MSSSTAEPMKSNSSYHVSDSSSNSTPSNALILVQLCCSKFDLRLDRKTFALMIQTHSKPFSHNREVFEDEMLP